MAVVLCPTIVEVRNIRGEILRNIDLSNMKKVEIIMTTDGCHMVIKYPKEYDCVLNFESNLLRESSLQTVKNA